MTDKAAAKWLLLATLVTSGAWACSDDDDAPPGGMAGSSGHGGDGAGGDDAVGAKGGVGGEGGNGGDASCGNDCPQVDFCGPLELGPFCEARPNACPTLDTLGPELCEQYDEESLDGSTATAYDTACGGRVVSVSYDFGTDTWGYDADGSLNYVRMDSDTTRQCDDGKAVAGSTVCGELPCERRGEVEQICGADGGQGGSGGKAAGGAGGSP